MNAVESELPKRTLRRLMRTWFAFERQLANVPILRRLDDGSFTIEDYRRLLLNLRPQVVEGARWISRAASSFDRDHADVRSIVIGHAQEEHRDYEVLERDYVAAGGDAAHIRAQPRNVGTEALHAFLMYRASRSNPADMLGAMWIIEGLGARMADDWAARIEELTGLDATATRFLRYHGENDDDHLEKLRAMIERLCRTDEVADAVVDTARVVGRLYALQLEEIEHAPEA